MSEKKIPRINSALRQHVLEMPETIWGASGILVYGRRIKSLVFSTDIAIIRNCTADAVLAVYPFTPQQAIANAIITSSSIPVFCGVGGGITGGPRSVMLAKDAEALGAFGVVVNAPMPNETIKMISSVVDVPVIVTVVNANTDIDQRLEAGASVLNVSAAEKTSDVVASIRARYPDLPIIATGGPTAETVRRTVEAGANAISYTPPSTKELFNTLMTKYRNET